LLRSVTGALKHNLRCETCVERKDNNEKSQFATSACQESIRTPYTGQKRHLQVILSHFDPSITSCNLETHTRCSLEDAKSERVE
jgi:hypothetical protein